MRSLRGRRGGGAAEEARGGKAPHGGSSRPRVEGSPGAGGGGSWERVAAEKTRARVAVAAAEIFGSLTASARALAQDLKNFSKSQSI
jgi:hypothetical protein